MQIKTVTALRAEFWDMHEEYRCEYIKSWTQNQYRCDIRMAWCDFVDSMKRDNMVSEKLANRATL